MKTITVSELAKTLNSEFIGNGDFLIEGFNSLNDAKETEASFLAAEKFKAMLEKSQSKVILVPKGYKEHLPEGKTYIHCENPNMAFIKVVKLFAPPPPEYKAGIHPTAVIADGVTIPPSCHIGPFVVIEREVVLGENTKVLSGCFIGEQTKIGKNCFIYSNCVIRERILIGNNVIIHPGVCIGSDGFGYEAGPFGIVKIPQVGIVKIEDDVEIGANCAIDRARFGTTWIKTGVKIDNLVQIAHNAVIGEFSLLIAQCGIAGSSKLGQGVIVAGQVGVSHGLKIGDGAKLGGQAGVTHDVPAGAAYMGTLAEPARDFMERTLLPKTVRKLKDRVVKLEETIKLLQEELSKSKK